MSTAVIRIDNRLVHGQILESWVPFLKASCIIVVSDQVAGDLFRESVIKMAIPRDIDVYVFGIEGFSEWHALGKCDDDRTIVLFSDIADVLRAYRRGVRFGKLNVGNVHDGEGKCRLSSSIFLNDQEITELTMLADSGIDVEIRCVPRDKSLNYRDVIHNLNK